MVIQSAAAVPVRDDRGRGSACAKAVGTSTSRGVGTSVTARTPNAGGRCVAGRRRGGRRDDARTLRPKPSTPRLSVRAVSAPPLRRKHPRTPQLRLRVVTQQKFCSPCRCATGRGTRNRPARRGITRQPTAAPPAARRSSGCWIVNASGGSVAPSRAAKRAGGNTRPPALAAAANDRTGTGRRPLRHRRRNRVLWPRRSAGAGRLPATP